MKDKIIISTEYEAESVKKDKRKKEKKKESEFVQPSERGYSIGVFVIDRHIVISRYIHSFCFFYLFIFYKNVVIFLVETIMCTQIII